MNITTDFSCMLYRISGDTALTHNIHDNVSKQMQANWAKGKWRVGFSITCVCFSRPPSTMFFLIKGPPCEHP